jgi:hypothetical protein
MDDREKIEALISDMRTLKASIRKNHSAIREMMVGRQLGTISLIMGIALTGFSLTAHFLSLSFGSYRDIPGSIQTVLIATVLLLILTGAVLKFISMKARVREMSSVSSLGEFLALYYSSGSMVHNTIGAVVVILGGCVIAAVSGHPWLGISIVSCAMAFPMNDIAAASGLKEFYFLGYWGMATGLSAIFYVEAAPFLALAICMGGIFLAFAVLSFVSIGRKRGK